MKIDTVDKFIFSLACLVTSMWLIGRGIEHIYVSENFQALFSILAGLAYVYVGSKLWWFYK